MSVVVLTFIASSEEISSGIPQAISIESNIPSTIYYTMDGTTPDLNSQIYIDTIQISTGINSITLSAFGVDSEDIAGPILTQFFAPDNTKITVNRLVGSEGIRVDGLGGRNTSTGFDADGNEARFVDVELSELEIQQSRGYQGFDSGTLVSVNIPDPTTTPYPYDDNFDPYSTPEKAELFNPFAKLITIDNRQNNEVNIIPRPWGSFGNIYREFNGKRIRSVGEDAAYVSGGFVKRFYDQKNGVMVSYYFDHNESKYIKNIQELPASIPNISSGQVYNNPLVFKWISRGKHSSI